MKSLSITLGDALHVNDAPRYLSYRKSPLRYCLNTEAVIMIHVGGHNNVSGKGHTFSSFPFSKLSFAQTFKKCCKKEDVKLGHCQGTVRSWCPTRYGYPNSNSI